MPLQPQLHCPTQGLLAPKDCRSFVLDKESEGAVGLSVKKKKSESGWYVSPDFKTNDYTFFLINICCVRKVLYRLYDIVFKELFGKHLGHDTSSY